jgi:bacteriorhodopsin/response regulator of citrate/malate metabolism
MSSGLDKTICTNTQLIDLFLSICLFSFFSYQKYFKKRCKFEVLYVTGVGSITDLVKLTITNELPASYTIKENGVTMNWSQFYGWMITCPVLLIHLSNLAGKDVFDVRRMMKILVIYQILMVSGATASMCENDVKWIFFCISVISLMNIFRYAFYIFREAKEIMPHKATNVIRVISVIFYISWSGFGVTWFFSPNGVNLLSNYTTKAWFALFDILSKNIYSILGWYLRWYIIRKYDKPEEFVEQFEEDHGKKFKVLLIENNNIYIHYFYNILVQHECDVDIGRNNIEIYEHVNNIEKQYDMILINHEIAKFNQYGIMFEIRKHLYMLPVIAYGKDVTEHDINCKNSTGIDDFLVAPFADDLLRKKLLQWSRRASVNPLIFTKQQGQQYQQYQQQTDNNSMGEQIDKVISSLNTFKQTIRY